MKKCILILDHATKERDLVHTFRPHISEDWLVRSCKDVPDLIAHVKQTDILPMVMLHADLVYENEKAMPLIATLRVVREEIIVIVLAEQGDVSSVAASVNAGATDFLVLGGDVKSRIKTLMGKLNGLLGALERNRELVQQNIALRHSLEERFQLVGESPQMQALMEQINRVAQVPRPVLIVGERGTGKELVARAIHTLAHGRRKPIVAVNCAAFTETLLESELFGHEKGAFTGAANRRPGKFEQAHEGTLFLDEIGNMSLPFQQKILRVVEYHTYTPVGGLQEKSTNARVIAATNANLEEKMRTGSFMPDLYDRLSFEVLRVPPLRERVGDIEVLSQHFLARFASEIPAFSGKVLTADALDVLHDYTFPGNVRELKNIIERAAYRDTNNRIQPTDLGLQNTDQPVPIGSGSFTEQIDRLGRRIIKQALADEKGNRAAAARKIKLSYDQFRHYLRKYDLN